MGCIYMRISPSGGKYIGQTMYDETLRWKQHCQAAYNKNASDYNCIISKAIRKYGTNNFTCIILENNLSNDLLDEREKYWINYYKTYKDDNNHGYNMTRGGEGIQKFSDTELLNLWHQGLSLGQIGEKLKGTPTYIGHRLKLLGIDNTLFKQRGHIQGAINQKLNNPNNKKIYILWQQGKTMTEIKNILNIDMHTAINMLKSIYNISSQEIENRKNQAIAKSKNKPIQQYDLNNKLIKEWPSATIASQTLHIDNSSIRKCIKGTRKTAGGYKWKEIQ